MVPPARFRSGVAGLACCRGGGGGGRLPGWEAVGNRGGPRGQQVTRSRGGLPGVLRRPSTVPPVPSVEGARDAASLEGGTGRQLGVMGHHGQVWEQWGRNENGGIVMPLRGLTTVTPGWWRARYGRFWAKVAGGGKASRAAPLRAAAGWCYRGRGEKSLPPRRRITMLGVEDRPVRPRGARAPLQLGAHVLTSPRPRTLSPKCFAAMGARGTGGACLVTSCGRRLSGAVDVLAGRLTPQRPRGRRGPTGRRGARSRRPRRRRGRRGRHRSPGTTAGAAR